MRSVGRTGPLLGGRFRHEALLYDSDAAFLAGAEPFIRDGLDGDAAVLVAVDARKIALLREVLGGAADGVEFADMAELGRNPARIIPRWHGFVRARAAAGRPARGIGEPVWPGRGGAELVECERHERLLNAAFADAPGWWLLCPYDRARLAPAALAAAERSHPYLMRDGVSWPSPRFRGGDGAAVPLDDPLPAPSEPPAELVVESGPLRGAREFVAKRAYAFGLPAGQIDNLLLAVSELLANSLRYGDGVARLRVWREPDRLVSEVCDGGRIHDPLVDRRLPGTGDLSGRGLWMVNQLCDLVQLRSFPHGTVVRVHVSRG